MLRRPHLTGLLALALTTPLGIPGAGFAQSQQGETKPPEPPIVLDELVVTASGSEQTRINAPATITVITPRQLSMQRNSSLAELLANLEGIDVGDNVGKTGGMKISLRGMPSDYTLILIDGRRQNAAGSVTPNGFGETSSGFLPPLSAIERIEVIRGPMSTLHGSDAMGGVINIITRKVDNSWRGSIGTDATLQENTDFGNTYSANLTLGGPLVRDLLGLSLRGSILHRSASTLSPTGEFDDAVAISRRGPSPVRADNYTLGAKLSLTPSLAHDLWLDLDFARQRYDNSEGQLGTLDRPDADPPTFQGYGPELIFERRQASLSHDWRLSFGTLRSSLMRNTTETLGRTLPTGTPGGPPGSGAPDKPAGAPRTLESTSTVFDSRLVTSISTHTLTFGGQLWDARMVDGVALDPFEYTQWSLFLEDEWRLADDLALTLGLRRDDHSSFGGHLSPRAYLVWNTSPNWTLKGGVSQGYKTPRVEQLMDGIIGFSGQGTIALIGTPSLRPETSTTTEFGLYYENHSTLGASISFFHNRFTDKITNGTPVPNCTFALAPNRPGCIDHGHFPNQESFRQSINVDRALTRGIEASARARFGEIWTLAGNYTYTESEQQSGENKGLPLTNTPRHMVNANLRAEPTDRLSGWIRGEYRSSRARRTTIAPDPAYDALGDYKAYSLFHLGGSYDLGRGITISATIYNLLDKDFLRYAAYQTTPTPENPSGVMYTSLYNNHQEGRRLWLSTNIQF